ncbi:dual specificity protein phosphatase family protein [Phanerochaete sordida]|uniref:Dual specificity protein phosphatase family protein n=1 Tax=Phanerochaete sordida TaxID=48140 RepID=A0A9P3GLE1_9APHY|nr:dual specificity protein phosphatase family protein [Phanerochaete sordida]
MRPKVALASISPINIASCYAAPMSPSGRRRTPAADATSAGPTEIVPRVFLADLAAAEDANVLARLGITHVLSAMRGSVALPPSAPPLVCLQLPLQDSPFAELAEHLPRAAAFVADALADPRARVLVHCVQGVSRSASVVCAFLMHAYGWTPAQALQFVKSKRPSADPNAGFVAQLGEYHETLRAARR